MAAGDSHTWEAAAHTMHRPSGYTGTRRDRISAQHIERNRGVERKSWWPLLAPRFDHATEADARQGKYHKFIIQLSPKMPQDRDYPGCFMARSSFLHNVVI
jgi:hypothetical protein